MTKRILVATDQSDTASRAVEWAADLASRYSAELVVVRVFAPEHLVASASRPPEAIQLTELAERLAPGRGKALLEYDSDPAEAIVRVADSERCDMVVVGNRSMGERTEFLLSSVPNRVSHKARCTVVIVNTSPGPLREVPSDGREAETAGEPDEGKLLGRAGRIAGIVTKYGLGGILDRSPDGAAAAAASARRLREALEELGPTFAKLGQILSTRVDLLPPPFAEELSALQDQVTPLSEAEVVAVMERELGVPWEDVFAGIEADPMAAGTIAQVHRAMLVGGERVVVKVQRPTAETDIAQDVGLLERFADKAAKRPAFGQVVDVPAIIDHLSSSLRRELDFRNEASNIEKMSAVLAGFDRLEVPRVYTDLSTARLLVMEEVQGVPVHQAPQGEGRRAAARQMLEAYYQQVLTEGFFHADPHPGNLMWSNDAIYLLDLGMVGSVDADMRQALLLLLLAFWQEDAAFLADIMLTLSAERLPAGFDETAFREELAALIEGYRHLSLQELRLGLLLQQLTEVCARHQVRLPAALGLIGKAFGQMQLTTAELDPSLDPFSVAEGFYRRHLVAQLRAASNPRQLLYEGEKLRVRAGRVLEGLEAAVGVRPGSGVQVNMSGPRELKEAIGQAGRRVAVGLTAATALIATAVTASASHAPDWTIPTFGAVAALLTGGLVVDVLRRH